VQGATKALDGIALCSAGDPEEESAIRLVEVDFFPDQVIVAIQQSVCRCNSLLESTPEVVDASLQRRIAQRSSCGCRRGSAVSRNIEEVCIIAMGI
jgi:hypothetical protein